VDERFQLPEDGSGPLFRRRYRVRIVGGELTPEQLMAEVLREPNRAAPIEVAVFRKTHGGEGPLAVGDEFVVRMPGPWDGPVTVVDRTPTSFRFATLKGHLEAGQIEFRTRADGDAVRFEIESWARSGDRLAELLFDRVKLAKEMQLHMWTHFCERAAKLARGRIRGGIQIDTRRGEAEVAPGGPGRRGLQLRPRPGRALPHRQRLARRRLRPGAPARAARPARPWGQLRGRPAADARLRPAR